MGQLASILRSMGTNEGQEVDGGPGEPTAWFPIMPIVPQSFPETGWGGSEREGGSWAGAMVSACWLGPRMQGLWRRGPFLPLLEMGPRELPLASLCWEGRRKHAPQIL